MRIFDNRILIILWILFSIIQLIMFIFSSDIFFAIAFGFGVGMIVGTTFVYFYSTLFDEAIMINKVSGKLIELQNIKIAKLQERLI